MRNGVTLGEISLYPSSSFGNWIEWVSARDGKNRRAAFDQRVDGAFEEGPIGQAGEVIALRCRREGIARRLPDGYVDDANDEWLLAVDFIPAKIDPARGGTPAPPEIAGECRR